MPVPRIALFLAVVLVVLLAFPVTDARAQSTTFRMVDLDLRDPHLFVDFLGCRDFTDTELGGSSFNGALQAEIQGDADGDGALDLSYLLVFMPLAQDQATNFLAVGTGSCSAPVETTTCGGIQTPIFADDAALDAAATCLAGLPGTTRPYVPAVTSSGPACFAGPAVDLTLELSGIPIPLRDAQIAATFQGTPATELVNGLLRGFVTEADANATPLPASFPLVGGQPLSVLLAGGTGNCAAHSDKDTNGVAGWWFYFNFHAAEVTVRGDEVFRDGFEAVAKADDDSGKAREL